MVTYYKQGDYLIKKSGKEIEIFQFAESICRDRYTGQEERVHISIYKIRRINESLKPNKRKELKT